MDARITDSRVVIPPTGEQLNIHEVYEHLRLDTFAAPPYTSQDPWILAQIPAVREWCENYLGLSLAPQTREWIADGWTGALRLPFGPVRSVDSVYQDEIAFSGYTLRNGVLTATSWPAGLRVRYVAGYDLPGTDPVLYPMPRSIRSAMLLLIGHLFENRESTSDLKLEEIPMGVVSLLLPYRQRMSLA